MSKRRIRYEGEKHGDAPSFSIMHVIPKPQPLLRLASNFPLLTLLPSFRQQGTPIREMIQKILDDQSTFGNDYWF